jgi:hypothetical protein
VHSRSPGEIAAAAADLTHGLSSPMTSVADLAADRSYTGWRDEILSLTATSDVTYFGWKGPDGDQRVAVLRGTVLSPLAVPSGASLAWGKSGSAARQLARTLLAETLGPGARCSACDDQSDCPTCETSGLNDWARALADVLADDVVRHLPAAGFELPASDVKAWIQRSRINTSQTRTETRGPEIHAPPRHSVDPPVDRADPPSAAASAKRTAGPRLRPRAQGTARSARSGVWTAVGSPDEPCPRCGGRTSTCLVCGNSGLHADVGTALPAHRPTNFSPRTC